MEWTNPSYLWALVGLLIPLAIHLLSRKEGKIVKVGSIRHLTETTTRKFSSIRFNEWLLFALRALSLILFVFVLAGLVKKNDPARLKWVLMEPGTETGLELDRHLDSLRETGYEFRYFTRGFPLMDDDDTQLETANYPFLLKALRQIPVEAIIFSQNRLMAFKGKQQALPPKVTWFQVDPDSKKMLLNATRLPGDTVALLIANTGPDRTEFTRRFQPIDPTQREMSLPEIGTEMVGIDSELVVRLLLLAPRGFEKDAAIIKAAVAAIAQITGKNIPVETLQGQPANLEDYGYIISFAPVTLAKNNEARLLTFREQKTGNLLVKTGEHSWELTSRLNRELAMKENLPLILAKTLLDQEEIKEKISRWDQRRIDESVFFTREQSGETRINTQNKPLDTWLIALLVLVFITERSIAFFREP